MQQKYSFDTLTVLRFFAALIVALHHTVNYFSWPHFAGVEGLARNGWLCVDFFFILSGFVLMWSFRPDDNKTAFIWRRIIRIYPLHIITLCLSICAFYVLGSPLAGYNGGTESVFINMFLLQAWFPNNKLLLSSWNGVSWTLSAELFFYVTAPICFPVLNFLFNWKTLLPFLFCLWLGLFLTALNAVGGHSCIIDSNCLFNLLDISTLIESRTTTEQYVNSLYTYLLHRPADADGLAYWIKQIDSGIATRAIVAQEFLAVNDHDLLNFLSYNPLVKWIDFILGASLVLLFKKKVKTYSKNALLLMLIVAITLIFGLISAHHYLSKILNFPIAAPIDSALFIPGALLLIYAASCWDLGRRTKYWQETFLILLGESSFAIYMVHALALGAIAVCLDYFKWFGYNSDSMKVSELITLLFLIIYTLLGVITHKYLEQPIRRYLLKTMSIS